MSLSKTGALLTHIVTPLKVWGSDSKMSGFSRSLFLLLVSAGFLLSCCRRSPPWAWGTWLRGTPPFTTFESYPPRSKSSPVETSQGRMLIGSDWVTCPTQTNHCSWRVGTIWLVQSHDRSLVGGSLLEFIAEGTEQRS